MRRSMQGPYVNVDTDDIDACGVCDRTGLLFNKRDLVKQMEWRGNSLQWTGLYVGRPFLDVPNPQNRRTPKLWPADPRAVPDARPFQGELFLCDMNNLGNCESIEWPAASLIGQVLTYQFQAVPGGSNPNTLNNPGVHLENQSIPDTLGPNPSERFSILQRFNWSSGT